MIAPPEASYADVLYAACKHILEEFTPNHPEVVDKIIFENDAMAVTRQILNELHADMARQDKMMTRLPMGNA